MKPSRIFKYKTPYYGVVDRYVVAGSDSANIINKIIVKGTLIFTSKSLKKSMAELDERNTILKQLIKETCSLKSDSEMTRNKYLVVKCFDIDPWRTQIKKTYADEWIEKIALLG
jgi:hypothetical protein